MIFPFTTTICDILYHNINDIYDDVLPITCTSQQPRTSPQTSCNIYQTNQNCRTAQNTSIPVWHSSFISNSAFCLTSPRCLMGKLHHFSTSQNFIFFSDVQRFPAVMIDADECFITVYVTRDVRYTDTHRCIVRDKHLSYALIVM